MICELSELMGLEIYSDDAHFLGTVDNVVLNMDKLKIYGLYVKNPNPLLVEDSKSVVVPFRWVKDVGDVVLLSYFPEFVKHSDLQEKVKKIRKGAHGEEEHHHILPDIIPQSVEAIKSHIPKHLPHIPKPHLPRIRK